MTCVSVLIAWRQTRRKSKSLRARDFWATCPRWTSLWRILYTCRTYPVALRRNGVFVNARARSACGLHANMSTCRAAVTPHADRDSRPLGHRCMSRHCCYLAFHHSCLLCHSRDTRITDSCGSRFPRHWQVCFIPWYARRGLGKLDFSIAAKASAIWARPGRRWMFDNLLYPSEMCLIYYRIKMSDEILIYERKDLAKRKLSLNPSRLGINSAELENFVVTEFVNFFHEYRHWIFTSTFH